MAAMTIVAHEVWDAGDRGCGELVLELRMRLASMPAGAVLELITRDRGAPADIPAWCRMTGNTLLCEAPPVYHIRKGS
jgi:tRNA 2-thiouridine synthesizing protein A